MSFRALALVLSSSLVLAVGCGRGDDRPAQTGGFQQAQAGPPAYPATAPPPPPPQAPQPQPGPPPPVGPVAQPGQMAPLGAILSDPNALSNIIAGALAGTSAALGGLTGGEQAVLEQGIRMKAQTDARGMRPVGPLVSARLQQNGHAEARIALDPGACYTVIGFGAPGVFQYQINLIAAPPLPPQVLAQSGAEGADPSVGPGDRCIRNPYPLPMQLKLDMHLVRGQGLVGAQLYRK
jgi:hypothetical protein